MKSAPKTQTVAPVQSAPTEWKADESQSVQGMLGKVIQSGSPLNQLAETKAKQESNARGLLNSSMAIGAGQKALYESALPIAQADATLNAQRAQFNAGEANKAGQFNAGVQNEAQQFNALEANKGEAARYDAATRLSLQDNDNASKLALQDKAQADALARMQQQFKDNSALTELQAKLADQSVPKQFASQFTSQLNDRVGAILADPNLTPEGKQNAVQNAVDFANQSLSWISKMYNVAFPTLTAPGAVRPTPTVEPPADMPPAPQQAADQQPVFDDLRMNGT